MRFRPFKKQRNYTLPIVIVLIAALISLSVYRDLFGARMAINLIIYPFQVITRNVWSGVVSFPSQVIKLKNLAEENVQLKEELKALKIKQLAYDELQVENKRLNTALGFNSTAHFGSRSIPARVIGRSAGNWQSVIEINKGTGAGVKIDMAVIDQAGLIGRVAEVGPLTAKVLLLTDPACSAAAVNQRSRDLGMVQGFSLNRLLMKYVGSNSDLKVGDKVVTAQVSTIFPAGIPIGTIDQVSKKERDLFCRVELKPAANFSALEEVFLVE